MRDYHRIQQVIAYLLAHRREQPSLAELAAVIDLSVPQFHRLFRSWAGVTPKQFLQYLTARDAKKRLRASADVLEAALDVGLSGPGRLHDLLVTLDGITPGEMRAGGPAEIVWWGRVESPFGACELAWTDRGLCHLVFVEDLHGGSVPLGLPDVWAHASFRRDDQQADQYRAGIFGRSGERSGPLRLLVHGTAFQLKVWEALLKIPEGVVVSYGVLAAAVGCPSAARAVGAACGQNPIAYLIPCHRVIRQSGIIDGYRWGTDRKFAMLGREAAAIEGDSTLPTSTP